MLILNSSENQPLCLAAIKRAKVKLFRFGKDEGMPTSESRRLWGGG